MTRATFLASLIGLFAIVASAAAQDGDKDKKDKKPVPAEEKVLNKTIGEWIKILREHESPKFRRAALIALEVSNASRNTGLPAILDALEKDTEPQVRVEVVNLLGRMGPDVRPSLKALIAALQSDKSDQVREAAATTISNKFADPAVEYVDVLTNALKDSHPGTRLAVVGALRNMGKYAASACPALIAIAANPKEAPLVRAGAVHIVSRHAPENPKTILLLTSLAKAVDNSSTLRDAAIEGLGLSKSDAKEVVAALSDALSDKNVETRKIAAAALGTLGPKAKAAWPTIKSRMADKAATYESDNAVRNQLIRLTGSLGRTTDEAIPVLAAAMAVDPSTENRIAAIQELGELGSRAKSALAALASIAADDARASVREAAEKAMQKIKGS